MKVSTKGRYGLRAMVELAVREDGDPVSLREIASDQQISYKYLEQLVPPLKSEGLLESFQGSEGGYSLAEEPENITVLEIIQALEGALAPAECIDDPDLCNRHEDCVTRELWTDVDRAVKDSLKSRTLKELADKKTGKA